jgi:hypothetical protein
MYGWILASFESTILNKFGSEKWKEIMEAAECTVNPGEFIKNVHYTDDLIYTIIACSEKILHVNKEQLMEYLGENFINFIRENGYDSTIRAQGATFGEFLENLNEPHRLLRSRFPDSYLPEFWCTKPEQIGKEFSCTLHYYSQRGTLFYPMVIGMLRELGKFLYEVNCNMEMESQTHEDSYVHTVFLVTYVKLPAVHRDESSMKLPPHPAYTAPNRILKCPFSSRESMMNAAASRRSSSDLSPTPFTPIGLSFQRFNNLFPFHIVINNDLEIIQVGDKMKGFLHVDPKEENFVDEIFVFQTPPNLKWSWNTILSLRDSSVELAAMRVDDGNVTFRGNVLILDPKLDPGIDDTCAMILLSPVVYNLDELQSLHMRLSDFPASSFQRDLMVLGEHIKVEQSAAVRLDVLSKKLEEESRKSLVSGLILSPFLYNSE